TLTLHRKSIFTMLGADFLEKSFQKVFWRNLLRFFPMLGVSVLSGQQLRGHKMTLKEAWAGYPKVSLGGITLPQGHKKPPTPNFWNRFPPFGRKLFGIPKIPILLVPSTAYPKS